MIELFQKLDLQESWAHLAAWFHTHVLISDNLVQVGLIVLALLAGLVLGRPLRRLVADLSERGSGRTGIQALGSRLVTLPTPILVLACLGIAIGVGAQTGLFDQDLIRTAAIVVGAWVAISWVTRLIRNGILARLVFWIAWIFTALIAFDLFDATVTLLDSVAMDVGDARISVLTVVNGVLVLGFLLWATMLLSNLFERSLAQAAGLSPSGRVLAAKIIKILLITLAFFIVISNLGIDLTALAVFGGALGIGIGFGLQTVMSNLVSGLLLLIDKSIKPGDVITVGGTYGWVEFLGARYTAIRTRSGIEHLIPNEDLIAQPVENWSHSDKVVRLNIPVGVSYQADVRLAIKLCLQVAMAVDRVLESPEPRCLLKGFGDSSVDLEIRIWIDDPSEGRANVISEVLLGVWDVFQENGIEIPFPQRDLHLKSSQISLLTPQD